MASRSESASRSDRGGRLPWLASELNRNLLATAVGVAVFLLFWSRLGPVTLRSLFGGPLIQATWSFLAAYSLVAALTIPLAFRGLRGEVLTHAVLDGEDQGPAWLRRLMRHPTWRTVLIGGGTMPLALSLSLASVSLVLMLLSLKALDLIGVGITLVGVVATATSWLYIWMIYALRYAREDLRTPSLDFPGGGEREFSDYVYFGLAGQVTFGTTDVGVTTAAMRRHVTIHALMAFLYNTVILAMIISILAG